MSNDKPPAHEPHTDPLPPDAAPADASAQAEARVGYGHPPKEHCIKPGERRNPLGRPKGSRNAKTIVREEHRRSIRMQESGRMRSKPAIEVLIRKDMSDALKGNEKAKARQITLALQIGAEDDAKAALNAQRTTLAEDEAILARYLPQASSSEADEP